MTYEIAKSIIKELFPDTVIIGSYKMGKAFMFSLQHKGFTDEDFDTEMLYVLDEKGILYDYCPVADPDEFDKILSNRIE